MKKIIVIFTVAALVLISAGVWIFTSAGTKGQIDVLNMVILIILVAFALLIGFRRLGSFRRGEPQEDELSKKVLQRTAALSYYISLYLWVGVLYIMDKVNLDAGELIGAGVLGMAIIFAGCWMVFNFMGVRNG